MDVSTIASSLQVGRASATAKSAATGSAASADSGAADSASVSAQPTGLYISPVLRYDQGARLAVLYFRDFDTGETRDQIPAERIVEQYRRSGGVKGEDSSSTDSGGGEAADSGVSLGESFLASSSGTSSEAASGAPSSDSGSSTGSSSTGGSSAYTAATTTGAGGYGASSGALVSVTV